jgi:hypothetical protein
MPEEFERLDKKLSRLDKELRRFLDKLRDVSGEIEWMRVELKRLGSKRRDRRKITGIAPCADCGKPFERRRVKQRFCSARCRNRASRKERAVLVREAREAREGEAATPAAKTSSVE